MTLRQGPRARAARSGGSRLDPIVIVPYDPVWSASFERERVAVEAALGAVLARPVEHIGSTAVPGLPAKAIIDMLAVVRDIDEVGGLDAPCWVPAPEPGDDGGRRRSFCAPSVAHRTHHLHVVEEGSEGWPGWLAFRDALRRDAALVAAYADLKQRMAEAHGADPDDHADYRSGKAAFVERVTSEALRRSG